LFTLSAVKNAKNTFATHSGVDNIVHASADDRYTIVMTLRHPDSDIDQLFSTYGFDCLLPRHLLSSLASLDKAEYNALPVGIGPFRYARFTRGSSVIAEANPYYFRGQPKLKRVEYLIIPDVSTLVVQLQSGEVDLWPGVASFAV
jgi:peptide/nickel transport system substrate-binding protein